MARINIASLSPDVQAQLRAKLAAMLPQEQRPTSEEEAELQSATETWLVDKGYRRLTQENAIEIGVPRGWFAHTPGKKCKGAPFVPDLLVYSPDMRRCLPVELKVIRDGRVRASPAQKKMLERGCWKLATDMEMFTRLVKEWDSGER